MLDDPQRDRIDEHAYANARDGRDQLARIEAVPDEQVEDRGDQLIERQPEAIEISESKRARRDLCA